MNELEELKKKYEELQKDVEKKQTVLTNAKRYVLGLTFLLWGGADELMEYLIQRGEQKSKT